MTNFKRTHGLILSSILLSLPALAAAQSEQAARLGDDLTPIGAERAGNADGSIPAWTGGLAQDAAQVHANGTPTDPFASEQPLFTITSENLEQHRQQLSPGQLATFNRYPSSYRIPVYPTHRSVDLPDHVKQSAARNLGQARLVNDGNGLEGFAGAIAFPIPKNGLEVIWNHITRYRGGSSRTVSDTAAPYPNGSYSITTTEQFFTQREYLTDHAPGKADDLLFLYSHKIIAPARQIGEVVLVHETIDQVKNPRRSWIYNAGQRRVRRAPSLSYDFTGATTAGLRTADSRDMFNGAPDRYHWELVGKRELYVPYNSYRLASPELKYSDIVHQGHLNQEHTRYERHRVWEVVSTLKDGQRHIYSKRRYFIDEDSWAILLADHYDSRGELWRVGESHAFYNYQQQAPLSAGDLFYDLHSGRYIITGMGNEQRSAYDFSYRASSSDYSPGALRSAGVR
ncbi:DUF1329 domain-containing protein [Pseudomonas jilinensis]|uniref:DUF1329 domain-containing protein n=1 Tax=Pseudomonas jilinensis TaxID=2078689 RepID=A0A396SAF8_9PSED|nr:DUF1329 domain-containing protein [Pseudomonas jilinensis]RHW20445.1 DUF1329 domain-containing protein [Pseudomonas jilinensis]